MAREQKAGGASTLPDWDGKESSASVNRRISTAMEADRKRKEMAKRGHRTGEKLLADVCARHKGDPKKQMAAFLAGHPLDAATGRKRQIGSLTRLKISQSLMLNITQLAQVKMRVNNISEIGKPHVIALSRKWIEEGLAIGTIQNKVSALRRFLTWVGKDKAIPKAREFVAMLQENGVPVQELSRQRVATVSKAWDEHGVVAEEIIEKVRATCPVTALQVEMQLAWGLRVAESIQIEPEVSDLGDRLFISEGTKGNRKRIAHYDKDETTARWQRDVLERAKEMARRHPQRKLSVKGLTKVQAHNRYYNIVRRLGVTKSKLGVTSHGLRHQFAARLFKEQTGLVPPVAGTVRPADYAAIKGDVHEAQMAISQSLGHWRKDITTGYLGSTNMLTKMANERIRFTVDLFEKNPGVAQAVAQGGVRRMWVIGNPADGLKLEETETLTVAVSLEGDVDAAVDKAEELAKQMRLALGMPLSVRPWFKSQAPQPGLEIFMG